MSRLNIDGWTITSDSRFALLAKLYPYNSDNGSGFVDRDHARGKLERAWFECLMREVDGLTAMELMVCIDEPEHMFEHLFEAIVNSDLAECEDSEFTLSSVLHFRGTAKRNKWLSDIREKRASAGKASGISRRKKRTRVRTGVEQTIEHKSNPPALVNVNAPAHIYSSPKKIGDKAKSKKPKEMPTEAINLAKLLRNRIAERLPDSREAKNPTPPAAWVEDIEKIHRIDQFSWERIREVLEWSQQDQFWQNNILSPSKLRKQFTALMAKASGKSSERRTGGHFLTGDEEYPDGVQEI